MFDVMLGMMLAWLLGGWLGVFVAGLQVNVHKAFGQALVPNCALRVKWRMNQGCLLAGKGT
jgi:hypothetical protein